MRAAEPRTIEATWRRVGDLLDLFSEEECANYLRLCFRIKTSCSSVLNKISG
jgi:hypothetical protein